MEDEGLLTIQEFRVERLSRRGEWAAWGMALISLAAWLILVLTDKPALLGFKLLALILAFSALAISLANWMDRKTVLITGPDGVHFENGLRNVDLSWDEIIKVEVYPSNLGDKVRVLGKKGHFYFRTLGEVRMQGQVKGRLGFEKGEEILKQILKNAHLKQTEGPGEGYYYSRD